MIIMIDTADSQICSTYDTCSTYLSEGSNFLIVNECLLNNFVR